MTKLESLATRKPTKEDIGKTVYYLEKTAVTKHVITKCIPPTENFAEGILEIDNNIIDGEGLSRVLYWSKPVIISVEEYEELKAKAAKQDEFEKAVKELKEKFKPSKPKGGLIDPRDRMIDPVEDPLKPGHFYDRAKF